MTIFVKKNVGKRWHGYQACQVKVLNDNEKWNLPLNIAEICSCKNYKPGLCAFRRKLENANNGWVHFSCNIMCNLWWETRNEICLQSMQERVAKQASMVCIGHKEHVAELLVQILMQLYLPQFWRRLPDKIVHFGFGTE